jgi:outer membrane protein assembly factor BamD (BamD/ComL family)
MFLKKNAFNFYSVMLCVLLGSSVVYAETSLAKPVPAREILQLAESAIVIGERKKAGALYMQVIQQEINNDASEQAYLGLIQVLIDDDQLQKAKRIFRLFELNHPNHRRLSTVLDIQEQIKSGQNRWLSGRNIFAAGIGVAGFIVGIVVGVSTR